jgi:peptidoglycan/LPS O-acetylase OafA/YrhL
LYNVLNQSAHGVDVFFVVSGYLIGGIIIREGGQPRFPRTFYVRRSLRILPIYFSTVSGVLVLFALAGAYPESAPPWWSYFLFLNNLFDGVGSGPIMPFGPFWSIALEEQFYLVAALTAYRFGQRGVIILECSLSWALSLSGWSISLGRSAFRLGVSHSRAWTRLALVFC